MQTPLTAATTDDVKSRISVICAALGSALKKHVGAPCDLAALSNSICDVLRHQTSPLPECIDVSRLVFRTHNDKLVPDDFYTALVVLCWQSGLTLPDTITDPYVTALGSFSWDAAERCLVLHPTLPARSVVIDFTVTSTGAVV